MNPNCNNFRTRAVLSLLVCTFSLCAGLSGMASPRHSKSATLSSGTVVPVTLNDILSSNNSQQGDKFTCSIKSDGSDFYNQLPSGTVIEGYVRSAKPKHDKTAGVLDLAFNRLRYPDGRSYPITAALIGLDNKSVTKTDNGRIIAKRGHKTDRLTYVGYGAGAGLIVGLLTKSTVQDTVIGAGLGYLFGALEKGKTDPKDVNLKIGTEMGVRLDRSLSVAAYQGSSSAGDRAILRSADRSNDQQSDGSTGSSSDQNVSSGSSKIGVLVGDTNVVFDSNVQPVKSHDTVLIPVRPVLDAAHVTFKVKWSSQTLTVQHNGTSIKVAGGSRIAVLNNGTERVRMEAPVTKLNGTLYVPLKFLSLATGLTAVWDEASQTVLLSQDK